jgi:transcriptional regulator with XRE-family HTH domain
MDNRTEVRDFLTSRRAQITPEQAGLPLYGTNRRVKGLRREEVALLADVSTDYYTRLERGNLTGVSESVLEALAAALQLDESERTHLLDLARAANTGSRQRRTSPKQHVRPGVQRILDSISAPAYVRNNRLDLLGVNRLGRALLCGLYENDASRPNLARYMFLGPALPGLLRRVGGRRQGRRRRAAHRGRPQPLRPRPHRPGRRALHPQRRLPHLVGQPQRPHPPHLHQADAPSRRWRP